MRKRTAAILACVAALLGSLTVWLGTRDPEPRVPVLVAEPDAEEAIGPPPVLASRPVSTPPKAVPSAAGSPAEQASAGERIPSTARQRGVPLLIRVTSEHRPVAGARVRMRLKGDNHRPLFTATSDAAGEVKVDPGAVAARMAERRAEGAPGFVFEALAPGFRMGAQRETDIRDRAVVIQLQKGVAFDGRVVDAVTSVPIGGASVVVTDWSDSFEVGPTDERGAFHVPGVMDDQRVGVLAKAQERATGRVEVLVDGGRVAGGEVLVRLAAGGSIAGTVRDPSGAPVASAFVWLRPQRDPRSPKIPEPRNPARERRDPIERYEFPDHLFTRVEDELDRAGVRVMSDARGSFLIEGLSLETTYAVHASAPGFSPSVPVRDLRARPGEAIDSVSLTLRRAATLRVRLRIPEGAPVPANPRVRVFLLPGDLLRKPSGVDPDGQVRFSDLEPGPLHAFIEADGFQSAFAATSLAEGESAEIDVVLTVGGVVEGIVTDERGRPLWGADVSVAAASRNRTADRGLWGAKRASTDTDGKFSIAGVPPGPALLEAEWYDRGGFYGTRGRVTLASPSQGNRVVLFRWGHAHLRVLTPEGQPFNGDAEVRQIHLDDGGLPHGGEGLVAGRADLTLEDGRYAVLVVPEGYAWIRREFTIERGADVDLGEVRLDPGVAISGRVVNAEGREVPNAVIRFKEHVNRTTHSDAAGRFAFAHVPRERVSFIIRADGYSKGEFSIDPATTTDVVVKLDRFAKVSGRIKGGAGDEVSGTLELRRPGAKAVRRSGLDEVGDPVEHDFYPDSAKLEVDETGRFEGEVPPGAWIVWWIDGKVERRIGEWTLIEGAPHVFDLTLPAK